MSGDMRLRLVAFASLIAMGSPLAAWWVTRSQSSEAWTGLLLLVSAVVVGVRDRSAPTASASLWWSAVGVVAVGLGVVVDVRLLQALGIGTLALALMPVWRPGAPVSTPALVLLWLSLPLSGDIDVVGFPLRRLSAELAALALPALGVPVAYTETVLVTEHGLADVEAPCAGLATIRLLVASVAVLAALRLAKSWTLGVAIAVAVVVAVVGNASRVTILSFLVLGAKAPDLAAILHVPLGVLVFLAAAAAAFPVLGWGSATAAVGPGSPHLGGVALVAIGAVLTSAWRVSPTTTSRPVGDDVGLASLQAFASGSDDAIPLTPAEAELYGRHALVAGKIRIRNDDGRVMGEQLVVVASSLRAIHAPERCLAGNGHAVVDAAVVTRAGVPVKRLVLDGGKTTGLSLLRSHRGHATGLEEVAAARLGLSGAGRDAGPWVFVSVVMDATALSIADEHAIIQSLVGDIDDLLHRQPGSPP